MLAKIRGELVLVGMNQGRIPWRIGNRGRYKALAALGGAAKRLAVSLWIDQDHHDHS